MTTKCDFCHRRATQLAGETNGVLVCAEHVERIERPLKPRGERRVVCEHDPVCERRPDGWPTCAEPDGGDVEALTLALTRAARAHLSISEGEYWPSDVALTQARAIVTSDWLAAHDAEVRRDTLREAQESAERNGWLRAAAFLEQFRRALAREEASRG